MKTASPEQAITAFVTGGASGIGRALVHKAAIKRWNVAIADIDDRAAEVLAAEAVRLGASAALAVHCDVASEESIESAFDCVCTQLGMPTAVAANAGIEIFSLAMRQALKTGP